MDDNALPETQDMFPIPVGERLKAAREARGVTLDQVAAETRIPLRQLQAIEDSRYDKLPAPTYSLGFVKAYARAIGENEVEMGRALRSELSDIFSNRQTNALNEPPDPSRIPSRAFAWAAALVGLLVIGGLLVWRFGFFVSDADRSAAAGIDVEASAPADGNASAGGNQVTPAAIPASGEVVLTATDTVWIGVKDASNKTLVGKELKAGESFAVPAAANGPVLTTSRPQALKVTVAGREIPPIGEPDKFAKVPLDAASLSARASGSGIVPTGNTTAAPGNGT